jgi:ketosteroid isomerase-like protein
MSAATELLDRLYDAINRRDLDAILELCTEDSAWDLSEVMPDQTLYRGHEGIRRYFDEIWSIAEDFHFEDIEYRKADDETVVAMFRLIVRGTVSGAAVDDRYAALWWIRGEQAAGQKVYPDAEAALKAVGLAPR